MQRKGVLPNNVFEGLESLLDKNLLKKDAQLKEPLLKDEAPDGGARYAMLEMIREYALERLDTSDGEAAERIRQRHAQYFLALAEAAYLQRSGAEQGLWLDRL